MSHIDEGLLEAYLDGELEEQERRRIEQHLESCIECRELLVEVTTLSRRVSALLAELEPGPVDPPPWGELEERAAVPETLGKTRPWLRPGLAWAASLLLAFSIGWWSGNLWQVRLEAPRQSREAAAPPPAVVVERPRADEVGVPFSDEAPVGPLREEARVEPSPIAEGQEEEKEPTLAAITAESLEASPAAIPEEVETGAAAVDLDELVESGADARVEGEAVAEAGAVAEEPPQSPAPEAEALGSEPLSERAGAAAESFAAEREAPRLQARKAPPRAPAAAYRISMATDPEDAASRLGGPLRSLPDLELLKVEVVPGTGVKGGVDYLPAVRMSYRDATGREIVLVQQRPGPADAAVGPAEPTLEEESSGRKRYRWRDSEGYLLILYGDVSSESLRTLVDLVR